MENGKMENGMEEEYSKTLMVKYTKESTKMEKRMEEGYSQTLMEERLYKYIMKVN